MADEQLEDAAIRRKNAATANQARDPRFRAAGLARRPTRTARRQRALLRARITRG